MNITRREALKAGVLGTLIVLFGRFIPKAEPIPPQFEVLPPANWDILPQVIARQCNLYNRVLAELRPQLAGLDALAFGVLDAGAPRSGKWALQQTPWIQQLLSDSPDELQKARFVKPPE